MLDYIADDQTGWEKEPLEQLAAQGQLHAYRHTGFWQPMDTLRDRTLLEELWQTGQAPWKVWHPIRPAWSPPCQLLPRSGPKRSSVRC